MNTELASPSSDIAWRPASTGDLPLLAQMNRQLIEDEGSRNPMDVAALAERMRSWLAGEYRAVLFSRGEIVVGYAVYQLRPDEYFPEQHYVYLRQFFVRRQVRRQGVGRAAFGLLLRGCLPAGVPVVVDVLETNPGGRRFWESLGFRPHRTTMHLPSPRP